MEKNTKEKVMGKRMAPFSNLTDFYIWQSNNCDKCCRYSNVSTKPSNAKCKLAFDLDFACIDDGTISIKTAENIGLKGGYLKNKCNDFNKPIIRKKYPKKNVALQTKLIF